MLQTDSEYVGGAHSFLDKNRFKQMLTEFLQTCEYDPAEIQTRAGELMMVALDRLVLLASREEGRLAFDVRSLQEFMAAAAMTSGNEDDVENRLNHIAGLSHWRHVFLIAASRCFSEDAHHHLRSRVIGIPRALDAARPDSYMRSGARLALEMFIDGIGTDHPKSRKLLAQHALDLLNFGPELLDERLDTIVDEQTSDLVLSILREKISERNTAASLAAWKLLISISTRPNRESFSSVAADCWPDDDSDVLMLLSGLTDPLPSKYLVDRALQAILKSEPSEAMTKCRYYFEILRGIKDWTGLPDHSALLQIDSQALTKPQLLAPVIFDGSDAPVRLRLSAIHGSPALSRFGSISFQHRGWTPLAAAARFADAPTLQSLTAALRSIADADALPAATSLKGYLPWPIAALVTRAKTNGDLYQTISDLDCGRYGTVEQWHATQNRWSEKGVSEREMIEAAKRDDTLEGVMTFPPLTYYQVSHGSKQTAATICSLMRVAKELRKTSHLNAIIELAQFAALGLQSDAVVGSEQDAREYLQLIVEAGTELSLPFLGALNSAIWSDADAVALIARLSTHSRSIRTENLQGKLSLIVDAFNRSPTGSRGLLTIIARCAGYARELPVGTISSLHASAFSSSQEEVSPVRLASLLLKMSTGNVPTPSEAAKVFCAEVKGGIAEGSVGLVNAFFDHDIFLNDAKLPFLQEMLTQMHGRRLAGEKKTRELYQKTLNARRSTLTLPTTWICELGLPKDAFTILQASVKI